MVTIPIMTIKPKLKLVGENLHQQQSNLYSVSFQCAHNLDSWGDETWESYNLEVQTIGLEASNEKPFNIKLLITQLNLYCGQTSYF